jgi:16S rRNA processing protein RimM
VNAERVCVGAVVGAHGVKGGLRVKSFTADPLDLGTYGPVSDEEGERSFVIRSLVPGAKPGVVLVKFEGVKGRDAAEALQGRRLYVSRSALPELEEEAYYHADLVGLQVELSSGEVFGKVIAVHDFGAGDVLEIEPLSGSSVMLPFTKAVVPTVELEKGRMIVELPDGWLDTARPDPAEDGEELELETE